MSELITLPGRRQFRVPTVFKDEDAQSSAVVSHAPEWIIAFYKDASTAITKGNLGQKGREVFIELHGWLSETSRYISGDLAGALFSAGSVKHSDLVLVLPLSQYGPEFEDYLYTGKIFNHIIITRLGWIEGNMTNLQSLRFGNVRLTRFQMNMRYLVLFAQIASRKNDITNFKQDGKPEGHKISQMDYSSGESKIESKSGK